LRCEGGLNPPTDRSQEPHFGVREQPELFELVGAEQVRVVDLSRHRDRSTYAEHATMPTVAALFETAV
jgi:hypothetical protein